MISIETVTLEVSDPTAALAFYTAAFGVGTHVGARAAETPTTGFPGTAGHSSSLPATSATTRPYDADARPISEPDRTSKE
jgi:catechol 2,3-dioxygenase-like lactoylglutathione lyase family enzyme